MLQFASLPSCCPELILLCILRCAAHQCLAASGMATSALTMERRGLCVLKMKRHGVTLLSGISKNTCGALVTPARAADGISSLFM